MIHWLWIILLDVVGNWWLINVKRKKPNYFMLNTIRTMVAILFGSWYFYIEGTFDMVYDMSSLSSLELIKILFPLASFQIVSHFVLFSPSLNLMRKKRNWFFYRGMESGWFDGIATGDYPWVYWSLYWICFVYLIWRICLLF